ncbi:MAG: electron transfer flavoprotein subunit alpha [Chloroflexi bacterium]|nr:electron transfer flavoprotein subunit alpha [Chloroflexota bacterium]
MAEKRRVRKPLGVSRLIPGKCIACGARCQSVCPTKASAIEMNDRGEPIIDITKCTGCLRCIRICPAKALEIYFTPEQQKILDEIAKQTVATVPEAEEEAEEKDEVTTKLKEYKGVWVYVEHTDGQPAHVSWELLGVGADLAKTLDEELCAVVIGDHVEHLCKESFAYGANKVYLIDDAVFHYYRTEPYYRAICYLANKYKPEIILIGATGLGRDLAGAVATELNTGLTADCTGLSIDAKRFLLQTRPAFGGNILATILTERTRPQMASVRPHVMPLPEKDTSLKGKIIHEFLTSKEDEITTKVLEVIDDRHSDTVDITAAEIIVAGGRGMQAQANFQILQELADELGGVVAASRAPVDAGWIPAERQVGQTGKTVRPKIYIACGISGAIQHLVGMQESDVIIAINRDKQAPIFEVATYGIIGDLFQIVPAITKHIRGLRASKEASENRAAQQKGVHRVT